MIFVATSSPIHPSRVRILGFAAGGRLTRRGCLTALRLRSIQPRTYDFHQTSPRGLLGVIGGIFQINGTINRSGVPWFNDIPVIGVLFRKDSEQEKKNELIVFITPTIIKRAEG